MTHTEKRVMLVLKRRWRFGGGGNSWQSFTNLAKEIHRPYEVTRDTVHNMKREGLLYYSPMITIEGLPCGSGYFITGDGY